MEKETKIEITGSRDDSMWYFGLEGHRFLVTQDPAGSKGCARWRVLEPSVLIFDVAQCISMVCTRYVRQEDAKEVGTNG
jgi:hypothetical protein